MAKSGGVGERNISRYYYYIDYALFVNVVKLKLHKIRQKLENSLQIQEANYFCSSCDGKWSLLETQMLFNPESALFVCPHCSVELEAILNSLNTTLSNDSSLSSQYHKFMEMQAPIVALLKRADKLVISSVDVQALIKRAIVNSNEEASINTTDLVHAPDRPSSPLIPVEKGNQKEELSNSIEVDIVKSSFSSLSSYLKPYSKVQVPVPVPGFTPVSGEKQADRSLEESSPFVEENFFMEVQGREIAINEISEEDLSLMTPEEYEFYYNALQKKA